MTRDRFVGAWLALAGIAVGAGLALGALITKPPSPPDRPLVPAAAMSRGELVASLNDPAGSLASDKLELAPGATCLVWPHRGPQGGGYWHEGGWLVAVCGG